MKLLYGLLATVVGLSLILTQVFAYTPSYVDPIQRPDLFWYYSHFGGNPAFDSYPFINCEMPYSGVPAFCYPTFYNVNPSNYYNAYYGQFGQTNAVVTAYGTNGLLTSVDQPFFITQFNQDHTFVISVYNPTPRFLVLHPNDISINAQRGYVTLLSQVNQFMYMNQFNAFIIPPYGYQLFHFTYHASNYSYENINIIFNAEVYPFN